MEDIGAIMLSIMKQLPQKAQNQLIPQLASSKEIDASPAGAILMGMHILEYVGFAKHVDDLLGEEHTSIKKLKEHYQDRSVPERSFLTCLLYTSDAADEEDSVDLGGRRIIKKKKNKTKKQKR